MRCGRAGTITVMNGQFQVCNGDKVQWYFPFEASRFLKCGRRRNKNVPVDPLEDTAQISDKDRRYRGVRVHCVGGFG